MDHAREVRVLRPSTILLVALVLVALFLSGCAGLLAGAGAIEAVSAVIGVVQRQDQAKKLDALADALRRKSAEPAPTYLCVHGMNDGGPATLCKETAR